MNGCFASLIAVITAVCTVFLVLVLVFSLLFSPENAVLESLPDYEEKEYVSAGHVGDFTDYGKYTYNIYEKSLIESPYFTQVTEEDIPEILSYIDNFEGWVEICEDFPEEKYDFDRAQIIVGDYCYILNRNEEPEKKFWNYCVYYFDLDTGILYYFHNNI